MPTKLSWRSQRTVSVDRPGHRCRNLAAWLENKNYCWETTGVVSLEWILWDCVTHSLVNAERLTIEDVAVASGNVLIA